MSEKNIYQRLHAAMEAVQYVQKEAKKNGMQYTFVSHDAVTAKVRPALLDNGIVLTVSVIAYSQDGNRTDARVRVRFVNIDKPDDFIEVDSFGYGIDPQDKGPGKAVSYGTKYALLKTLCLETGDDPERDNIPHENALMKKRAAIDAAADRALELNEKDDEVGAFGELYDIVMGDSDEDKLYLWNYLRSPDDRKGSTPQSRVRSMLKRLAERERSIAAMDASGPIAVKVITPEELATQG